jgi:hypothetical protein
MALSVKYRHLRALGGDDDQTLFMNSTIRFNDFISLALCYHSFRFNPITKQLQLRYKLLK